VGGRKREGASEMEVAAEHGTVRAVAGAPYVELGLGGCGQQRYRRS
jgi:hypothetical protein